MAGRATDEQVANPVIRVRVGVTTSSFSAAWPIVGLRLDDEGFELAAGALIGRLLAKEGFRRCGWHEVASMQASRSAVMVDFRDRRWLRISGLRRRNVNAFVRSARQGGVRLDAGRPRRHADDLASMRRPASDDA